MSNLIEDISDFLESEGIAHSLQMRYDMEVLCARTPGSDRERLILPIGISARTVCEATAAANQISECLQLIKGLETYPVIITEDRWRRSSEMMKSRLMAHLEVFRPVFARNCEVRRIDKAQAKEFLSHTHAYGYAACRHCYGLFSKKEKDKMLAVATFSNARKWQKGEKVIRSYEWTRYASLPDLRISGGMGKMLKHFIKETAPDDIMSYADLEWSEGNAYEILGFKLEGEKKPVIFKVNASWERSPVKTETTECTSLQETAGSLYFQNLGSNKYRLKLTDYQ